MTDERTDPRHDGDERTTLREFLDLQRATVAWKVAGLDTESASRRFVPSKTTLLGLVKHLVDVERHWFVNVFAGEPDPPIYWERDGVFDSEFDLDDHDRLDEIVDRYRQMCARSRAIESAAGSLDQRCASTSHDVTLRWIMVHMIEETARHAGHADLLRELTDGSVGE
ncbi:MAG: DinB family protein [Actinomycetes bacterium]